MKTNHDTYKLRGFLPNYFKRIGLALAIISVLGFIGGMIFEQAITIDKEAIATITLDGVILGLLIISLSKTRIEDEMIMHLRLNAFAKAFIFGTAYLFSVSLMSLIMHNDVPITPHSLIIVELIMFICFFEISLSKLSKQ
ncbi:MAG: hypothetical protein JXB00_00810 [Bacteroidales bacterium]|nr:hypothetical protein [Bacteroidales bacterium]